mmetsp:Transcript_120260/g.285742  ORF Transcript_120260/g.285742 Transcript_120260/m.285742 type:complete len:279 (+) Transcript_120260:360-1196(+)
MHATPWLGLVLPNRVARRRIQGQNAARKLLLSKETAGRHHHGKGIAAPHMPNCREGVARLRQHALPKLGAVLQLEGADHAGFMLLAPARPWVAAAVDSAWAQGRAAITEAVGGVLHRPPPELLAAFQVQAVQSPRVVHEGHGAILRKERREVPNRIIQRVLPQLFARRRIQAHDQAISISVEADVPFASSNNEDVLRSSRVSDIPTSVFRQLRLPLQLSAMSVHGKGPPFHRGAQHQISEERDLVVAEARVVGGAPQKLPGLGEGQQTFASHLVDIVL